jgi:YVTN family beta-propeller protein
VTATIPVGTNPIEVAANTAARTVYVSNQTSSTVSVISEASNTVTATIPVGNTPEGVAVDGGTGNVYVANSGDGTVSVISPPSTSGSVTANATVSEGVSLTGLSGTITFPPANPGTTATATRAEAYTAATNDTAGYTVTLAASGSGLVLASGGSIPNTDLTVTETGASPVSQTFGAGSGSILTTAQTHAPSSDNYTEDWALAIPATAAASTYSESFVYLALGN